MEIDHKHTYRFCMNCMRLEVFVTVKIEVAVFWIVTCRSDVVGYQHFGGPCCLHLCFTVHCHNPEECNLV